MSDQSIIARVWNRLQAVVGRGRVKLVDDAGAVQKLQVKFSDLELISGLRRVTEFGFTSHPPADTDAIAVFIAGDRSKGAVIATNHQASRLRNLAAGDAAIYDSRGRWVWLKESGIEIEANGSPVDVKGATTISAEASVKISLTTPLLEVSGDITSGGDIVASGVSLTTHTHSGVQPGAGSSGPPQ